MASCTAESHADIGTTPLKGQAAPAKALIRRSACQKKAIACDLVGAWTSLELVGKHVWFPTIQRGKTFGTAGNGQQREGRRKSTGRKPPVDMRISSSVTADGGVGL